MKAKKFSSSTDEEDEGFNVGYLLAYDDDYVLMQQMDDEGRVFSYLIIRRDADAFIDQTDTYLDNILKLQKIAKKHETHNLKSDFTLQNNGESILLNVLSYLKDSQM